VDRHGQQMTERSKPLLTSFAPSVYNDNDGQSGTKTASPKLPRLFPRLKMKLTQEAVERLRLPSGKDEIIYFDDQMPGFGVRLRAGGSKRWLVQYRIAPRGEQEGELRAKQRRLTLGSTNLLTLKEAREKARKPLVKAADGEDPARGAERRQGAGRHERVANLRGHHRAIPEREA